MAMPVEPFPEITFPAPAAVPPTVELPVATPDPASASTTPTTSLGKATVPVTSVPIKLPSMRSDAV